MGNITAHLRCRLASFIPSETVGLFHRLRKTMAIMTLSDSASPHQVLLDHETSSANLLIQEKLKEHLRSHNSDSGENAEDSFFVADMGEVYRQFGRWRKNLEKVQPFYGIHT